MSPRAEGVDDVDHRYADLTSSRPPAIEHWGLAPGHRRVVHPGVGEPVEHLRVALAARRPEVGRDDGDLDPVQQRHQSRP